MENGNNYQKRYWKELDQLKVHFYYLEGYHLKTIRLDRALSIFTAITSNGSICGWAIWNECAFFWGVVIAASQLLNAIKAFLPYKSRLKALPEISSAFGAMFIHAEEKWFDIVEGKLSENEIHKAHMELKKKLYQIEQKCLSKNPLPEKGGLLKQASKKAADYFNTFYSLEDYE